MKKWSRTEENSIVSLTLLFVFWLMSINKNTKDIKKKNFKLKIGKIKTWFVFVF